ncbi:MAG: M6 family metalloprotease domain-containing protein [Methanobacterium sp.]|nr:M6 family metalloprotease domain-containing protein [Methanobacterium sp.]
MKKSIIISTTNIWIIYFRIRGVDLILKEENDICQERLLHPSVYKRFNKTRELIDKKVDPSEFHYRGGLDQNTYHALQQRWQEQKQIMKDHKKEVKAQYGSLKAAPLSLGPFEKIDPVIGTKNTLVLLTEFKDVKHIHNSAEFEELLFNKGSNQSMRDYYLEASWNQLDIIGKINENWYTASNNITEYIDEAVNIRYPLARKLVKETIMQAKDSGIDFTPFAKDGKIEYLIVIYAGFGQDSKANIKKYIRPHHGQLSEPIELQKGIFADKYALIPERPLNLGCYCHEMGHLLGLHDFYNERMGPIVGSWCLMAYGDHINEGKTPAHPSAWCKVHLGWREPKKIQEIPQNMEIPAVIDKDGVIYKMEVPGTDGGEYFLLENRQQKGFDRNLPGSGLLIWHVDETKCIHKAPNSDPKHLGITLEQSDGKKALQRNWSFLRQDEVIEEIKKQEEVQEEIKKDIMGDEGDAYPGITVNRDFDENSNPNSNSLMDVKSGVSVNTISDSDDLMKAQIGLKHEIGTVSDGKITSTSLKTGQFIIQNYISFINSQKTKDQYSKGYEDGIQDLIEKLKEEQGLKSYHEGYQLGYQLGYEYARKNSMKIKKRK